ncbi:hypothetical protein SBRCBS47491_000878 [Sporothrix bragantina]|uniref:RRM domain-containing protein n=1 Tax=Sporothrix bragantina TaxID=671064 RepID=A0ABP0AUC1_9PEZI
MSNGVPESSSAGQEEMQARIRQLETDLRRVEDQLRIMTLNNANQMFTMGHAYNIASTGENSPSSMKAIKNLLYKSKETLHISTTLSPTLSSGADAIVTPPSTAPGTQPNSESESTSPGKQVASGSSSSGTIEPSTPVQQATPKVADTEMRATKEILIPLSPMSTTQKNRSETKPKPKPLPKDMTKKAKQPKVKEIDDDDDAMWQEFSLEEELEGIADAPAQNRDAMRAALHQKEEEHRKRMRKLANEKRRIAEHEGYLLKKTFGRPAAQKRPADGIPFAYDKVKQYDNKINYNGESRNSNGNFNGNGDTFGGNTFGSNTFGGNNLRGNNFHGNGKRTKCGGRAVRSAPRKPTAPALVEAPGQLSDTIVLSREPDDEESGTELNETGSSGIINIDPESPKNATRFGVVFDPSRLDAATVEEVGGTGDNASSRRSLLIQNIPYEYSLHKLLAHVRGGSVVMARLVPDTMGTGHGQVAMITFTTAKEAAACKKVTQALLSRSEANEGQALDSTSKVSVSLLPTPTYPSRETIVPAATATGLSLAPVEVKTRCIYVTDFPKHSIHELCKELQFGVRRFPSKLHALEEMWFEGDTLHLQFSSMQEAEKAHRIISMVHYRKYNGQVHYGPDPCAAPVTNMDDLFVGGMIKVASHGFMGLKTLLETVGLASFSRSHENLTAKTNPEQKPAPSGVIKMSFSTLLSQTRTVPPCAPQVSIPRPTMRMQTGGARAGSLGALIDVSFDQAANMVPWNSVRPIVHEGFSSSFSSAPWTADQMMGLDKL